MPNPNERFADRHIGPRPDDVDKMLATIGAASLDDLVAETIPASILDTDLDLPPALSEGQTIERLSELASKNVVMTSLIGLGYHDTITPPVIQRNVLESPAWYTAYTPYQPEISQGRLEALLNFQSGCRQRLAARRSDCRCRGNGHVPPSRQERSVGFLRR